MCGIAGILGNRPAAQDRLATVLATMRHRGPDAKGIWSGQIAGRQASLLHTRLAIVDLDPRATQPFEGFDCVLSFNGEIYNHRELRTELAALGDAFRTSSDTEVVVAAYRRWGADAFARFEGMWAIALYDKRDDVLWLGRDAFGEKPLFYLVRDDELVFGSEVNFVAGLACRPLAPNLDQVRRYLVNGYRDLHKADATWYRDLREVPVGTVMRFSRKGLEAPTRYWQPRVASVPMSLADAENGVRDRVVRALDLRLRADVPIAFCLSGGVDSTVLASLAARRFDYPVHAFSIVDSDPRYDESASIAVTVQALGCKYTLVRTSKEGFLDRLASQIAHRRAPVATISYHLHEYLSQAISQNGYKVAVSGTGADEILSGYYDHYSFWLAAMSDRPEFPQLLADWQRGFGATVRNPVLQDPLVFRRNQAERGHLYLDRDLFQKAMRRPIDEDFAETRYCAETLRNRMVNELRNEIVPVILSEDDLNSMRYSVENRSPYLDRELVDFAYSVPIEHLIKDGMPKWLLRAAGRDVAPHEILFDRRKRGFNASIDSLLDRRDPNVRARLLDRSPIFDLVDRAAFESWLDADLSDNSASKFMFSFASAKLFLEAAGDLSAAEAA
jgi:asparagine synthase (glutamine-hydrolysing)